MGLWSRTYCCCAVPLYNTGIYTIIGQFAIISIVTGILSLAAPKIISVAIPSFGGYILGVVCLAVASVQLIGFLGVYRERPSLYRTYARLNTFAVIAALGVALAFIVICFVRHNVALTNCEALFAKADSKVAQNSSVCNIWMWAQVGVMGLLWVIVAVVEGYFLIFSHIYGSEQKLDHAKYETVFETVREEIRQSGLYSHQSRPSAGSEEPFIIPNSRDYPQQQHQRQSSGLRNEVYYGDHEIEDDKAYGIQAYSQPVLPLPYEHEPYQPPYQEPYQQPAYHDPYSSRGGGGYSASAVSGYQDASLPRSRGQKNVLQQSSNRPRY